MTEIGTRLEWYDIHPETGKFYDHRGTDTWYYFAYGESVFGSDLPVNPVASRCMGKTVRGDVAVVRSGPEDSHYYPVTFMKMDLVRTAASYKTANPNKVFAEREKTRFGRKMGFPPGFLDGVPALNINM